ncbi:Gldg family protein [Pseudomonas sp. ICMP 460]|uniref:Gldg family protein n=1 Tax=Pseudomonas sp. ICMP 460 TaxID=1718917 RepID=UPI000C06B9B4|nr:Gldg family protein [Pseudomonas sp. ICMP 460]PHN21796.1 ABC transporter [Pseudomonas sp. ICMP 460]
MRSVLLAGMTLMVILLLFLAFNLAWVNNLPDIRWDFSQKKIHTLSPPARQLLATLEQPLDIYYFNSSSNPNRSQALDRYGERVEDLLKEYEKAAKGMLNLHVIDPAPYSEDAYKAGLFGLDDTQGFLGLIGKRAGQATQRMDLISLDGEPLLEYEISHLIYTLMHPAPPTVGVLTGLSLNQSATQLLAQMHQHFKLVGLASTTDQVPESIETLMVVHPRALPDQTLYAIDQFVLRGGKLMIFIDPLSELDVGAASTNPRLEALLAAWGIQMPTDKLVVDTLYASPAAESTALQMTRLTLPRQSMTANDVSSWKLNTLLVSSSGTVSRVRKGRTTLTPLLQSSRQSALLDVRRAASVPIDETPAPGQRQVIAARIEGPAYSVFPDGIRGQAPGLQKANNIQVVVVADTDLLMDGVIGSAPNSNALFVLNTLDNLAAADILASIRPRAMASQLTNPLEQMREVAALTYTQNALELERRLAQTEQEWQRLNPPSTGFGTQAVVSSTQLQALNKERLRLPMELQALKVEAYAQVHRAERYLKLLMIVAVPLLVCLFACAVLLYHRRRRTLQAGSFH